jgi:hypothetical protein
MDISMNEIDNITLEYFLNKSQYQGLIKKHDILNDKNFISEKKFYKKRILDLTKKLFRNEIEDLQLKNVFNGYIKSCCNYLKFQDKKDIIQENYSEEEEMVNEDILDQIEEVGYNNCDYLILKEKETKKITMDNFIIKNEKKPSVILPEKKKYNLKSKDLKTKGIEKKKNINNKYEDIQKT